MADGPGQFLDIQSLIRCPCDLKSELDVEPERLKCRKADCGKTFPIVDGVPVLINDDNSVFAIGDYLADKSLPQGDRYKTALAEPRGLGSALRRAYRRFALALSQFEVPLNYFSPQDALAYVTTERPEVMCLVVGSGAAQFAEQPGLRVVCTDITFGPDVRMIADAHDLPFADASFDLVLAVAVLEHVVDPQRCVGEFQRVLKSDGFVYAATPFLQPVHMGAHDFTRFTYLGHRRLFRWFDDIKSGMALGPGSVLGWSIQRFLLSFTENAQIRKVLRLIGLIITLPFKYCDLLFRKREAALDAAGGVYFFGKKRTAPLSDRALIKMYRGGD